MTEQTFDVVFDGQLVADSSLREVKLLLARSLRVTPAQLEAMFAGRRLVLKAGVGHVAAIRWVEAFRQCGAVCRLVPHESTPPSESLVPSDPPSAEPSGGHADRLAADAQPRTLQQFGVEAAHSASACSETGTLLQYGQPLPDVAGAAQQAAGDPAGESAWPSIVEPGSDLSPRSNPVEPPTSFSSAALRHGVESTPAAPSPSREPLPITFSGLRAPPVGQSDGMRAVVAGAAPAPALAAPRIPSLEVPPTPAQPGAAPGERQDEGSLLPGNVPHARDSSAPPLAQDCSSQAADPAHQVWTGPGAAAGAGPAASVNRPSGPVKPLKSPELVPSVWPGARVAEGHTTEMMRQAARSRFATGVVAASLLAAAALSLIHAARLGRTLAALLSGVAALVGLVLAARLWAYSRALGQAIRTELTSDLDLAAERQRRFWRSAGLWCIAALVLAGMWSAALAALSWLRTDAAPAVDEPRLLKWHVEFTSASRYELTYQCADRIPRAVVCSSEQADQFDCTCFEDGVANNAFARSGFPETQQAALDVANRDCGWPLTQ